MCVIFGTQTHTHIHTHTQTTHTHTRTHTYTRTYTQRLMSHDPRARPTAEQVLKNSLLHTPAQQQQAAASSLPATGSFAMAISP